MRYDLDLTKITLDAYHALLKTQTLLPSRRLLLDDIDSQFERIRAQGVTTVAQLLKALSSPRKIETFVRQSGVNTEYLAVLRREAGTLKRTPVKLSVFPDADQAETEALAKRGILTVKDCFERGEAESRLYALSDLSRINGVGPNAACMFYAAGCRSVKDIADADAETLLSLVTAANKDHRYYAGKLGLKDMRFCIGFANMLENLTPH